MSRDSNLRRRVKSRRAHKPNGSTLGRVITYRYELDLMKSDKQRGAFGPGYEPGRKTLRRKLIKAMYGNWRIR
jgi:hypothetical protein